MGKLKIIILYIFFASFVGCKTKQVASKVESIKSDTLIIKSKVIETPPLLSSLIINEICDSTTGKAVQFRKEFIVKNDTILIETVNDDLQIKLNIAEDIISKQDSIISVKDTQYSSEITNEKKVIPKWVWYVLALIPIFIIFPSIPSFINKIIKSLFI